MPKNPRREHQKTAQLCSQVAEALSLALAAVEDDVLLDLYVLDVSFRSSTVLGIVGAGGIGFLLNNAAKTLNFEDLL